MKKFVSLACAAAIAAGAAVTSAVPAFAAPIVPQPSVERASDVDAVQYRRQHRRGFYKQGNWGYYNGHRGHREYRPGYRRHGAFWFPAGAFIAGAIIGGALSDPGPRYYEDYDYAPRRVYRAPRLSEAHVQWCYDRYRSYRASDNTFQPYEGPRQQCYSPY